MKDKTPDEIVEYRESIMQAIEKLANDIKEGPEWHRWLAASLSSLGLSPFSYSCACRRSSIKDQKIKALVRGVNGPLLHLLARNAGYHDTNCVDLFRVGAPIVGQIAKCAHFKLLW